MTLRVFIHSPSKRADTITLLDSGATENFMSLSYAKWLNLPIKRLPEERPLYNVDGTINRGGQLKYYTDLNTRTGTERRTMRFFLTELGENKVILGYPWFASMQPKIDWKWGWLDPDQLPLILSVPEAPPPTHERKTTLA